MARRVTGRQLADDGTPIPDTGFEYDPDGRLAELLSGIESPLHSQPATGAWAVTLTAGEETGGDYARGIGIFAPGADGPPEHFHPSAEESFEIVSGEFVFVIDGDQQRVGPGDELTIEPGVSHTFRSVSEETGAVIGTVRPPGQADAVIKTLYGRAHEGHLAADGSPTFVQGLVMTAALSDDIVFTSPPPLIMNALSKIIAPIARRLGYRAVEPKYTTAEFWHSHVEQPTE
jgi:mannose-6-phosphate isomerase-like protein (cupin superfamily)